jgi:hypothetical protein
MDPQQELFTWLLTEIRKRGYDVYDGGLPPGEVPYPFVYLADSQQTDRTNKNAVFGTVYQTNHVWGSTPRKRGTVSAMLLEIKGICRSLEHTPDFSWMVENINQRILADTTTKQPLLHGILEVEFWFS